tara:strand:- start:14 stop:1327 length:1314 start_codon:yes stop_codon:yes gene_type:complete
MTEAAFAFEKTFKFDGLKGTLSISIPVDVVKSRVDAKISEVARTISLPGFRSGKSSSSIKLKAQQVRNMYLSSILQEEGANLADQAFNLSMEEEKVSVAGEPDFDVSPFEWEQPINFTVNFEKTPDINKVDLAKVKVKTPCIKLGPADKKDLVDQFLKNNPNWKKVSRQTKDADQVTINFEGKLDGEVFPGGTANDHVMTIGGGQMLEEFEANLVGQKADKQFEFPMTFPDDYEAKDLAGKTVTFAVTITKIEEPSAPKLTKEFYKKVGIEATNKAEFEAVLEERFVADNKMLVDSAVKIRMYDALDKAVEKFELPEKMVAAEAKRLDIDMEKADKKAVAKVKTNVRTSLILQQVIKDEEVKCSEEDIVDYIRTMCPDYFPQDQFIQWYLGDRQRLEQAQFMALENKVFDYAKEKVKQENDEMPLKKIEKLVEDQNK